MGDIAGEATSVESMEIFSEKSIIHDKFFSDFIEGSNNRIALSAAMYVAENPGKEFNPLFIHGAVGNGKTHLLNAIGNYISSTKPYLKLANVCAERLSVEMLGSFRGCKLAYYAEHYRNLEEFRKYYRSLDVFLLDGIDFISGKVKIQEELLYIFNALLKKQKQIVITGYRLPEEIEYMVRSASRPVWGLFAEIEPYEYETKIKIIDKKAKLIGIHIPRDLSHWIASKCTYIREIEGCLIRLDAYSRLKNEPIDFNMAMRILADF